MIKIHMYISIYVQAVDIQLRGVWKYLVAGAKHQQSQLEWAWTSDRGECGNTCQVANWQVEPIGVQRNWAPGRQPGGADSPRGAREDAEPQRSGWTESIQGMRDSQGIKSLAYICAMCPAAQQSSDPRSSIEPSREGAGPRPSAVRLVAPASLVS